MNIPFSEEHLAAIKRNNDKAIAEVWRRSNAQAAKIGALMNDAVEGVGKALIPVVQKFGEAVENIDNSIRENYLAAGAPYGDTNEGRWRWMNEISAQERQV